MFTRPHRLGQRLLKATDRHRTIPSRSPAAFDDVSRSFVSSFRILVDQSNTLWLFSCDLIFFENSGLFFSLCRDDSTFPQSFSWSHVYGVYFLATILKDIQVMVQTNKHRKTMATTLTPRRCVRVEMSFMTNDLPTKS